MPNPDQPPTAKPPSDKIIQLSFLDEEPAPIVPKNPKVDWRSEVPSVSQLTRRLRGHVENSFFDVWVKGEISNFKKPASGHAYFILKDTNAALRVCMFRPALSKVKFDLRDGTEVLLHGKITVYEAKGDYQIIADAIEPVGAGALQLAFEQLKAKLLLEGLFDARHKKRLPALPRRIGIVTSSTGAAVRDILKVLSRRFPKREILILPASVQGEKAAAEIAGAIRLAERWNRERPERALDVLIVGRGGGSLEDLWPFNEETVARAIFNCTIPVISAVGHEVDYTIADFVADLRAPTPSAAAEIVVPKKEELTYLVEHQIGRLATQMRRRVEQMKLHLGHLGQRLVDPRQRIKFLRENITRILEKLQTAMHNRLHRARQRLQAGSQMLHSLSPLQVIARGYTLSTLKDGTIVRRVTDVLPGDRITTRVTDGLIVSEVLPPAPKRS